MAKNRGRDVSITRSNLPLTTTRLLGVSPLGIPFSTPALPAPNAISPSVRRIIENNLTVQPTPPNRVAKNVSRNDNLYRPTPIPPKVKACQNRTIRKQVIFATGKGGRNGMKTARYTPNSKVKC